MSSKEMLHDDLNGTPTWIKKVETVAFGLHGKQYLIDVTEANRKLLEAALKPFLDVARPATEQELTEPEFLLDEDDEADEADEADEGAFGDDDEDEQEEAPAQPLRSNHDLGGAERTTIHLWLAEQHNRPRKYGAISKTDIAEYDAAHAG